MEQTRTVRDHLDALGGPSAVARELEAPVSTVGTWGEKNFVPRWWRKPLLDLAKSKDYALIDTDLPTKAQKPREAANAA